MTNWELITLIWIILAGLVVVYAIALIIVDWKRK